MSSVIHSQLTRLASIQALTYDWIDFSVDSISRDLSDESFSSISG